MKNDCEVCGEGFITEQVDFIEGVPLLYASCSYCKCGYATHIHLDLNTKAKEASLVGL